MTLWHDNQGRLRSGWRFLLGAVVAVIANYIAIGVAVPLAHRNPTQLEAIYRPLTLILLFLGFSLLLMSADQVHEGFFSALGLGRFRGWWRQALVGFAIGSALIVLAVLWILIFGDLRAIRLNLTSHTLWLALVELFILSTAALGEELMFRGYPFQRLLEAAGPVIAVIIMSLLFGFAHGGNPHASRFAMLNTFAIGALLCLAYLRTGALWMSWGIHFAWNTVLGLAFGLPVSGLNDFAVIIRTRATGPRWVTGGAYGIEASVVGTIVIALGFIPVILLTRGRTAAAHQPPAEYSQLLPQDSGSAGVATPEWDMPSEPDQHSSRRIQEG